MGKICLVTFKVFRLKVPEIFKYFTHSDDVDRLYPSRYWRFLVHFRPLLFSLFLKRVYASTGYPLAVRFAKKCQLAAERDKFDNFILCFIKALPFQRRARFALSI